MKKFKFFNGISIESTLNNGVTDLYLIQLNNEIMSYSDWVSSNMLIIDEETGLDSLIVQFTDIDYYDYWCQIFGDFSFVIFNVFNDERGRIELMETIEFSPDTLSDCNNLITYLKNMPRTIKTLL